MTIKLPPDSRVKDRFEKAGNMSAAWVLSADSLLSGARVLIRELKLPSIESDDSVVPPEQKLLPSAFLLYGFAMENLLKALWLARGSKLANGDRLVSIPGLRSGHDLVKLAQVTNFTISEQEAVVLQGLHIKLISSARYPVGTDWNRHRPVRFENGGFGSRTTFNGSDIPVIEGMVSRLAVELGYNL